MINISDNVKAQYTKVSSDTLRIDHMIFVKIDNAWFSNSEFHEPRGEFKRMNEAETHFLNRLNDEI